MPSAATAPTGGDQGESPPPPAPPTKAARPGRGWPATEVKSPAKKALMSCFAEPEFGSLGDKNIAHGKTGFPILFVDSHAAFTTYKQLNQTKPYGDYNLDWTVGGLRAGEDLK